MSGSYWRLDAPTDERAIAFTVLAQTPDVRAFARQRACQTTGRIDAERLASDKPLEGTLCLQPMGERRIAHRFAFSGDDGRRYELSGLEEWSKISPVESLTLLPASLYDDHGNEFARATLRFDLRADWARWLGSFRLRWAW